jgi:hypothetical protein
MASSTLGLEPSSPISNLTSSGAILTYPSINDLSGSIPVIGLIGITNIRPTIGPNPDGTHTTITGALDYPIRQGNRVASSITWKGKDSVVQSIKVCSHLSSETVTRLMSYESS